MEVVIVNLPACADVYVDGEFRLSLKEDGVCPLPLSDDDSVSVYPAGGPEERVSLLVGDRSPMVLLGNAVVLTDGDILCHSASGETRSLPNAALWAELLSQLQDTVGEQLGRCDFFPMTDRQKRRVTAFVLAYLSELRQPPQVFNVPIFAWYNYAMKSEADEDELSIPDFLTFPFDYFGKAVEKARNAFLAFVGDVSDCHLFLRNSILLSFIKSVEE